MSFDLKADENGVRLDLTKISDRARARRRIQQEKPYVVIGSPPCTDFCTLNQNINHKKMSPDVVRRRMVEARLHLEFCAEVCRESSSVPKFAESGCAQAGTFSVSTPLPPRAGRNSA